MFHFFGFVMHIPVLVEEVVSFLRPTDRVVVDGTLGHGGHTRAMRDAYVQMGVHPQMIGCDIDPAMFAKAVSNLSHIPGQWYNQSYQDIITTMKHDNLVSDFFLIDIGINWDHILDANRGFSIHHHGPLDMRFCPHRISAADLIVSSSRHDIAYRLHAYGDIGEKKAYEIAGLTKKLCPQTTTERKKILSDCGLGQRVYPQCFQALRIAVNDELGGLHRFFDQIGEVIAPGGRLALISFHSGEDRIIKHRIKMRTTHGGRQLCGKTLSPRYQEIQKNRASRSARLRVIEKVSHD
ncbi:MAG: 16S rRNA (cytosine(1402)-N(4))-methyltransferase RsmH [Candidatus Absconditabacterales bacterium]|nr:16S rRNA (cytosine(1402)-N(4))-methyltransferase RsmH [Candidatus Absconditabacterales bacterium]